MYLAGLPGQIKLTYNIKGVPVNILLVHGSTRSNEEYVYENHDLNDIYEMLSEQQADILIMGHTHESYIRTIPSPIRNTTQMVINCGSAGRSKEGKPLASYLLIAINENSIKPELIKLEYPVNKVIKAISESGIPDFYADFLKT
ncbi:metallophosphoesterase family protein [Pedobacter sp. NJ-S-72]